MSNQLNSIGGRGRDLAASANNAWSQGLFDTPVEVEQPVVAEPVIQHNYTEEQMDRVRNMFPGGEFSEEMMVKYLDYVEGNFGKRVERIEPAKAGPEYPSRKEYVSACVEVLQEEPTKEIISKVASNLAFVSNKYESLGLIPEVQGYDRESLKNLIIGGENANTTYHSILLDLLKVSSIPGLITGGSAKSIGAEYFLNSANTLLSPVDIDRIIMNLDDEDKSFSLSRIQVRFAAHILARFIESKTFKNSVDTKGTIVRIFSDQFYNFIYGSIHKKGLKTKQIVTKIMDFMFQGDLVPVFNGDALNEAIRFLHDKGVSGQSSAVPRAFFDGLSTYSGNDINHGVLIADMIETARLNVAKEHSSTVSAESVTVYNFIRGLKGYKHIKYSSSDGYNNFLFHKVVQPQWSLIVCDSNLFANVPGCNDNKYGFLASFVKKATELGIRILYVGNLKTYTVFNISTIDLQYGTWLDIRNGTFAVTNMESFGVNVGFDLGSKELFGVLWKDYLTMKRSVLMYLQASLDSSQDLNQIYGFHYSTRGILTLPLAEVKVNVTKHKSVKKKIKAVQEVTAFSGPVRFDDPEDSGESSYDYDDPSEEEEQLNYEGDTHVSDDGSNSATSEKEEVSKLF